jgi:hypothetical protein
MSRIFYISVLIFCCLTLGITRSRLTPAVIAENDISVRHFTIPMYNLAARQAHIQGDVIATVHIRGNGTVDSVTDVSGPPLLAGPVQEALKSWSFALRTDIPTQLQVTFHFALDGPNLQEIGSYKVSGMLPGKIEIVTNPAQSDWP